MDGSVCVCYISSLLISTKCRSCCSKRAARSPDFSVTILLIFLNFVIRAWKPSQKPDSKGILTSERPEDEPVLCISQKQQQLLAEQRAESLRPIVPENSWSHRFKTTKYSCAKGKLGSHYLWCQNAVTDGTDKKTKAQQSVSYLKI